MAVDLMHQPLLLTQLKTLPKPAVRAYKQYSTG